MTQTLIEKLEALPRYDYESRGYMGFNVWQATPDGKGEYIRTKDLRAIIEQHKQEVAETIGVSAYECEGCGTITRNPDRYRETLRKAGHISCCPDDKYHPVTLQRIQYPQPDIVAELVKALEDDAYAASFQSMAGYRTALIAKVKGVMG